MSILIIVGMFGPQEIILILVIVLLLFGGRKIPELMKGLGKGMKEFKKASNDDEEEDIEDKSKKKNTDKISDK
ncbi:MAG: twin-arginine translocase TatA/TatE family subunit [Prolixibacteraceae bacterium]|nr:twin-arginine translocase TatA/TatE family subunit [Prolixibacteraceae bacterium]